MVGFSNYNYVSAVKNPMEIRENLIDLMLRALLVMIVVVQRRNKIDNALKRGRTHCRVEWPRTKLLCRCRGVVEHPKSSPRAVHLKSSPTKQITLIKLHSVLFPRHQKIKVNVALNE